MIGFGCFGDRAMRDTASIAVDAGDLKAGRRMVLRILDKKEKNLALADVAVGEAAIARAFAEHGDFTSAEGIARRLADQAARATIMAAMGGAYAKTGRAADAKRSFERARQCALRIRAP